MPKGARNGKSEEVIKSHLTSADYWKHYKDVNFGRNWDSRFAIDKTTYTKFLKIFFDEMIDKIIYENYEWSLPFRLGRIFIRKFQTKVKIEEGKVINNYPPDWNATLALWERDEEARENKTVVKHLNKGTSGYVYRFMYSKRTANYKNKYAWWFKPTRQNKMKLKSAINQGYDFYNAY